MRSDHPIHIYGWRHTCRDFGGMLAIWLPIIYLWVFRYWGDYEMWDRQWFFDAFGHLFIAGLGGGFNILYVMINYTRDGTYDYRVHKWKVSAKTIGWVAFIGFLWEIGELVVWDGWLQPDFFPWVAEANQGHLDMLIDIALNPSGAWLATRIYPSLYFFYLRYTDALAELEIQEITAGLEQSMEELHARVLVLKKDAKREMRARLKHNILLPVKRLVKAIEDLEE